MKKTNPFYGAKAMKELYDCTDDRVNLTMSKLDAAYEEARSYNNGIELFFTILIAIGDIDRQHNIFKSRKESGGFALRDKFRTIVRWLLGKHPDYFSSLLYNDIFVEYVGWDTILKLQVNTVKKTERVKNVVRQYDTEDVEMLAKYIASWIIKNKNEAKRTLLAKQLVRIDGRKRKLPQSKENVLIRKRLYDSLSELMDFEVDEYGNHVGLYEWRKKYIQREEFFLFSTGKILDFDKVQFTNWINTIPSEARRRVKKRIKKNDKYSKLYEYYLEWEESKKEIQKEKRKLEAKRSLSIEDKIKLEELKKDAKVNTGASSLYKEFTEFLGTSDQDDFNIRADSILDKVNFRVPVLPIIDNSSSMRSVMNFGHTVAETASILATIIGLKNPTEEDIFIRFGTEANVVSVNQKSTVYANRFGANEKSVVIKELLNKEDDFLTNFRRFAKHFYPNMGGTDLCSVHDMFVEWADNVHKKEQIQDYQVFLVFSDAHFNKWHYAPENVRRFMHKMKASFAWEGVLVIWDLASDSKVPNRFDDIDNVIHFCGWNPNIVNQIMANIHDLDVIDSYTNLLSLYRSDRYELVREAVR